MGVLKKGRYLGKYKQDNDHYHHFTPDTIGTEGSVKYMRIGDYEEEFPSDRNYIIRVPNEGEMAVIKETRG